MKKIFTMFFVSMLALNFAACSSDNSGSNSDGESTSDYDYSTSNPPAYATTASADLHYNFPDQYNYLTNFPGETDYSNEITNLFSGYTSANVAYSGSTVTGFPLGQFIDEATVNAAITDPESLLGASDDARELYAMVIVSNSDGFSIRGKPFIKKGMYLPDITWNMFSQGYLLDGNCDARVYWTDTSVLPTTAGAYSVTQAYDIYLLRKIDVKRPDSKGSIARFEVGATTTNYVDDTAYTASSGLTTTKFTVSTISFTNGATSYSNVNAISMDQFLTTYVIAADTQSSYAYNIVALNTSNSQTGWTYAQIQASYYLPDYDFICQVNSSDSTMVSGTKISFPVRIELVK